MATKSSKQILAEEEVQQPDDMAYWNELVELTVPKTSRDTPDAFISTNEKTFYIKAGETVLVPRYIKKNWDDHIAQQNKAFEIEEKLAKRA